MEQAQRGKLWVIATPIGNLSDISARARQKLAELAVLACENKTAAQRLLSALQLPSPRIHTYREDNEADAQSRFLEVLEAGQDVGLITDAGTPAISDPGWRLVEACHRRGVSVFSIAGPSSVTAALSVAGLPTRRFLFEGFPPHKNAERREFFQRISAENVTTVVLESPHKILETLQQLRSLCGDERKLALCRELTKLHETNRQATLAEWCEDPPPARGEFVLVLEGAAVVATRSDDEECQALRERAGFLAESGLTAAQIRHYLMKFAGASRNQAYKLALETTNSEIRENL
jgi:16S rRNA (cytidine1402-2'-O)-methyltransferase